MTTSPVPSGGGSGGTGGSSDADTQPEDTGAEVGGRSDVARRRDERDRTTEGEAAVSRGDDPPT